MSGIARFISILSVASTLFLAAGHAGASALVLAGAQLDWNSLSITSAPGVTLNFRPADYQSSVDVGGILGPVSHSANNWTDPLMVQVSAGFSGGGSRITTGTPSPDFSSTVDSEVAGSLGTVTSTARRFGVFDVSGSGLVTLAIGYSMLVGGGTDPGYSGGGVAEALIRLERAGGQVNEGSKLINFSAIPNVPGSDSAQGTLTASMLFNDGDIGDMTFMTYAEASHLMISQQPAAAPEPGSLLLVLGGIAGLRLVRRRT